MRISFQGFLNIWCRSTITSLTKKWLVVVSGSKCIRANIKIKDLKALLRFTTATKGNGIPQCRGNQGQDVGPSSMFPSPVSSWFTGASRPGRGGWGLGNSIVPHLLFEGQETSLCQFLLVASCRQICQAVGEGTQMLSGDARWGAAPVPLCAGMLAAWQEWGLWGAKTKEQQLILTGGSCHQNV